jgi:hypothetical protein
MKLIATRYLKYGTRRMLAGDEFEAKPAHARLLIGIKKARDASKREPVKLSAPPLIVTDKIAKADKVKHEVDPTDQPPAVTAGETDDLATARAEYQAKVGKRPFHGWGVAELRAKMAESDLADVDIADIDTAES